MNKIIKIIKNLFDLDNTTNKKKYCKNSKDNKKSKCDNKKSKCDNKKSKCDNKKSKCDNKKYDNKKCDNKKSKLSIKKITKTINSNYYIKKNNFTTLVKKINLNNSILIYTKFLQDIEYVSNSFDMNNVTIKVMILDKLGRLYIGGNFNKIGNLICNNIAMWDGYKWYNLSNGIDGEIQSIGIDSNNNLFVGGSFNGSWFGKVLSKNIIKWNGTSWESLDGGVNNNVYSIGTLSNGKIVIGGSFDKSITSETTLQKIAKWDNSQWVDLGASFLSSRDIYALAIDNNDLIYIGGYYLQVSVLNTSTGIWTILMDSASNILEQIINTIIIHKVTNNPIFGGRIENFGSISEVYNVIEFNVVSNTWLPLTNLNGYGLNDQCYKLFYNYINNQIIAGGFFSGLTNGTISDRSLSRVAVWDGVKWNPISVGINGENVQSFELLADNTLFIGGDILGSNNLWSIGLVIYTPNYINICEKDNILYKLTNFNNSITISNKCDINYIFQQVIE